VTFYVPYTILAYTKFKEHQNTDICHHAYLIVKL